MPIKTIRKDKIERMDDTSEVISRLKFLAKVKKGEKINTRYIKNLTVQPDGLLTSINRTIFTPDNRENTITFIISTIKRGFELLEKFSAGSSAFDQTMTANLHNDLYHSLEGLAAIKETYAADVMFCCKIDTILQDTLARLGQMGRPGSSDQAL